MALFDGKLKQRLIGALVLIILAVVFLPMIFNNKGETIPETVVTIPTEPTRPATPANHATTVETSPAPTTQTVATTNNSNETTSSTITQPVIAEPTTQSTDKPAVAKPDANGLTPTWTIQVAAVKNLKNAESFMKKLQQAGYNAYIRSKGDLHRIFVGPVIAKAEANKIRDQIQKQFKEDGRVILFKPESE